MRPSSAKAKGRKLQQLVRDKILKKFPTLEAETDVRSAIMGETGCDVKLSSKARKLFPFSIECKSLAKIAVYSFYEQASANTERGTKPLVIFKANRKKPMVMLDLDTFMEMVK